MITSGALIEKFQQALKENWGYIWGTAGVKWTAQKQHDLEQTTDQDRAQGRKYGSKWIGHTVSDCSGLFSWAFAKLGGQMYHGSNTMYMKWCVNKGELKKGKRTDKGTLKPGTAVFHWNGSKYSHVGLYVGDGTVIEAASTQKGVITAKVTATQWTHWGELKGVTYDSTQPATSTVPADDWPTLRQGNKNKYVSELQTMLVKLGYDVGSYGIDGDFGKATLAAVKSFQSDNRLSTDGIVGPATWSALDAAIAKIGKPPEITYTVTIVGLDLEQAQAIVLKYPGAKIEGSVC